VQPLLANLTLAGKPPVLLAFPDGTRLLVLPFGGRLLGLFPPGSDENFLWTNPALATPESAAAWLRREGWPNPGGDRTWLAPEIDLFIGDLARPMESYVVPPALDPGCWTVVPGAGAELCLTNSAHAWLQRSRRKIGVDVSRSIRPATNPLRDTPLAHRGLQYAGYTLITTLELEPVADAGIRLGIWNLLQLPQPGEMRIPTSSEARPQFVFGAASADELTVAPRLVRWNMGSSGDNAKIGLKALSLTGRVGYLRRTSAAGIWDLVVRQFQVDPNGDYVDALWVHPYETGWAFQACCVRSGEERFNELEYHVPAVTAAAGVNHGRDESRVWAFRGPGATIAESAEALLGTKRSDISFARRRAVGLLTHRANPRSVRRTTAP